MTIQNLENFLMLRRQFQETLLLMITLITLNFLKLRRQFPQIAVITIKNKNSRNMNEKAEDTDNCSLDSDDYLQQPAETQLRVMKKRTRTTKSSPKIILPQDWREKPRSQLREELLGQDLDVDIGSSEDELQTEQQPSLIPTPFSLRHTQVMNNHVEILETNQAISSTGFKDDDIEDIMVNIEENCEKNEKSKKTKKTKKNRKESITEKKKKDKDEMKTRKKKKRERETRLS